MVILYQFKSGRFNTFKFMCHEIDRGGRTFEEVQRQNGHVNIICEV